MNFKLVPYLQSLAAARGAPLTYAIFLDHWLVWCVDEQQARLIQGLWEAWCKIPRGGQAAILDPDHT